MEKYQCNCEYILLYTFILNWNSEKIFLHNDLLINEKLSKVWLPWKQDLMSAFYVIISYAVCYISVAPWNPKRLLCARIQHDVVSHDFFTTWLEFHYTAAPLKRVLLAAECAWKVLWRLDFQVICCFLVVSLEADRQLTHKWGVIITVEYTHLTDRNDKWHVLPDVHKFVNTS